MNARARTGIAAAVLTVALVACGNGGPGVSRGAARELHSEIAALRTAATGGDRAATTARADRVELLVAHLRAVDAIDEGAARRLRHALAVVRDRITLLPAPTTTTTTTTTVPAPEHGKDAKGHGRGKGHDD